MQEVREESKAQLQQQQTRSKQLETTGRICLSLLPLSHCLSPSPSLTLCVSLSMYNVCLCACLYNNVYYSWTATERAGEQSSW